MNACMNVYVCVVFMLFILIICLFMNEFRLSMVQWFNASMHMCRGRTESLVDLSARSVVLQQCYIGTHNIDTQHQLIITYVHMSECMIVWVYWKYVIMSIYQIGQFDLVF